MLDLMKQRTKVQDSAKLLRELRSAYRWAVRRVYNAAGGPDLLTTIGEELPVLAAVTRDYDLGAAVTGGEFLGVKMLSLKLPIDSFFTEMQPSDANATKFASADSAPVSNPNIAQGHPVMYTAINFSKVRFAPALPIGAIIRADYFRIGPVPDPTTNPTQEDGVDFPAIFHDAVVSKAVAQIFTTLDDTREGTSETRARDELNDAIYLATSRTKGPVQTRPVRSHRRGRFI